MRGGEERRHVAPGEGLLPPRPPFPPPALWPQLLRHQLRELHPTSSLWSHLDPVHLVMVSTLAMCLKTP